MAKTIIKNAKIFDGIALSARDSIAFENGLIVDDVSGQNVIDGTGYTLLPGFIDSHIHLDLYEHIKTCAKYGITTALDMASRSAEFVDSMKNVPRACDVLSCYLPAFAPESPLQCMMGFPEKTKIKSIETAKEHVREQLAYGADYIKIILEEKGIKGNAVFPVEIIAALVEEAHRHGKKTIAHAVTPNTFLSAVEAGVDVLTHIPFAASLPSTVIENMVKNGQVCIPTMIMMKTIIENFRKTLPNAPLNYEFVRKSVSDLHKAGVPIFAGTDANYDQTAPGNVPYGTGFSDELDLLIDAGLSSLEALQAATGTPAKYFGLSDRGVIQTGKRADLILIEDNPFEDISNIRKIKKVWIKGIEIV